MDLAFADVVATFSDLRLAAIRLAWWRERLEALDQGTAAPAEPRLEAVEAALLPRGITGKELSQLEDAWLPLLEPFPWGKKQSNGLQLRGTILFGIGARLLGREADEAERAGALWSLVDGAQHCSDSYSRDCLREHAATVLASIDKPLPRQLRVLTVLAALAAADTVHEAGGLKRLSSALKHRLWGTFPR